MNCCAINQDLQLFAVGTEKVIQILLLFTFQGHVVCFDSKNETFAARLNVSSHEKLKF